MSLLAQQCGIWVHGILRTIRSNSAEFLYHMVQGWVNPSNKAAVAFSWTWVFDCSHGETPFAIHQTSLSAVLDSRVRGSSRLG